MLDGIRTDDGDRTLFKQRETSQISSFLHEYPASTNVLVVEPKLATLLKMKKLMVKYGYQVTVYADAEPALEFLRNCEHEINLVIWDFHMPIINGIQALKIICTNMDLPVVIMSDDDRTTSVMKATVHGACNYVMKPVRKEIIATIWQHIVRKKMMSKLGLIPPVQLDVVHNQDSFKQEKDDFMPVDQGNSEQNINMIGENLPIQSDLVKSNGLDTDNNDSWTTSPNNYEQNIDGKERKQLKKRMAWTKDLQEKFLKAIDDLGGAKKANPKPLLKMLEDMNIKGLTRRNVCSHLQKYRLSLQGKQTTQQMQEFNWSTACTISPHLNLKNVNTATSSLINGGAPYPVQENQYQKGYMEVNNNNTASSSLMTGQASYSVQDNQHQNGHMVVNTNHIASSSLVNGKAAYPIHDNKYQKGYMEMTNNHPASSSFTNCQDTFLVHDNQYQNAPMVVNNNHIASSSLVNGKAAYTIHDNKYQKGYMEVTNNHAASSPLTNCQDTYLVHDNQYQNGYLGVNKNQVMTNTMPHLPFDLDHDHHFQKQKLEQQQQQKYMLHNQLKPEKASSIDIQEDLELTYTMPCFPYDLGHGKHLQQQQQNQLPHQWNNLMSNNEPELASSNAVTSFEGIYPSLPYDPNGFFSSE